jgi:hypothetical protein
MSLGFAEYPIHSDYRDHYMKWVGEMTRRYAQLQVYEGTDQPNLFVESWEGMSHEDFTKMKQFRQEGLGEGDADLRQVSQWLAEGKVKINMWHFQKVK